MNRMRFHLLLLVLLPLFCINTASAQDVTILGPVKAVGTVKDSIYTATIQVTLVKIDSGHVFIELPDSTNGRLLAAGVKRELPNTAADLIKDTVVVKRFATTKGGIIGITYQELVQAFGGTPPPDIQFYLAIDKDATVHYSRALDFAVRFKEVFR